MKALTVMCGHCNTKAYQQEPKFAHEILLNLQTFIALYSTHIEGNGKKSFCYIASKCKLLLQRTNA